MTTRWILFVALLALLARLAACADCTGPTAPAKLRALYIANLKDNSPAGVKAYAGEFAKWMKSCDGLVVREGHAPAITKDPGLFGFKALPNNSYMGDYGGWSDWRSLEDLRACVAKGLQDGSLSRMRSSAVRVARIVFALDTKVGVVAVSQGRKDCSDTSFAPAKLRMMIAYVLKDPSTATAAVELQNKVSAAAAVKPVRYGTGGRVAFGKDEYVWGSGISKTADWGVWYDFASEGDVRGYFAPADAAADKVRSQLRALSAGAVRIAIPLA